MARRPEDTEFSLRRGGPDGLVTEAQSSRNCAIRVCAEHIVKGKTPTDVQRFGFLFKIVYPSIRAGLSTRLHSVDFFLSW